ncbi:TatD family hydrolase [Marinobacterium jannaschii]|uniref:TatD family hydrolase n=1 Tax=Marinobacterium jannaschii TaxID=64970 RepID=UPI00055B938D|nr:TatD family hydrolase [Marinobacterium jannaschii]
MADTFPLIDTHCHLDFPAFDACRDEVIEEAADLGVSTIVMPGVTAADWPRLLALQSGSRPVALGLHPCFIAQHRDQDLELLSRLLAQERVVAVGEIGLDFFIKTLDSERQLQLFDAQLALAAQFDLPVLLHVRKAHDQVLQRLRQRKLPRAGIVHAFSGSEQQARQYIDLGFKLGFGGAVSYSRATKLRQLAAQLPLEAIVLETDAPDMPLAEYPQQINRPSRVFQVAGILAQLRGVPLQRIAAVTTANARQLLNI